jgi:hypothetical protein
VGENWNRSDHVTNIDYRLIDRDGSVRWVNNIWKTNSPTDPHTIQGVMFDITPLMLMKDELQALKDELRAAQEKLKAQLEELREKI